MNGSLFAAVRRQPVLPLLAVTALFVALMAVQAQAGTETPSTAKLCANPAGQLTLPGASGCTSNTTEVALATADANGKLEQRLTELALRVEDLGNENAALNHRVAELEELQVENEALAGKLAGAQERIDQLESRVSALEEGPAPIDLSAEVEALQATFAGVTRDEDTLVFEGMNVQVVNGTGTTSGVPNSVGNLIIGYNEQRSEPVDRSGSHYLVVGDRHSYTAFGGIVAGFNNTASGRYASVSGGLNNTASGYSASVAGGLDNTANGNGASVSGGAANVAEGDVASVSGGSVNTASGAYASVSGGTLNTADGSQSSILGGRDITLSGINATYPASLQ